MRRAHLLVATVAVAVAASASACGGSPSPGVAGAGGSTSTTQPASAGDTGNSGPAVPTGKQLTAMLDFAKCVRTHGVPAFPDPPYSRSKLKGFNPSSPQMLAATKSCHADALASGWIHSPAAMQRHQAAMLKIAECMQAHGIANFPDPDSGGGFMMSTNVANEPGYAAAAKACDGPPGNPDGGVGG